METVTEVLRIQTDPIKSAKVADLCHVSDLTPGIKRIKRGKSFIYLDINNKPVKDKEVLKRIKSLVIPPAWTQVWICPEINGHLQATGRDAKGRKQYRYHFRWQKIRNELKFDKMLAFGQFLPLIRKRVKEDLARPGLPREKVLALVFSIMEETLIRIGNQEYVNENNTFGLTTMQNRHVEVDKAKIEFKFRGKSGKYHVINFCNHRLAKLVKRCQELPGHSLFEYLDEEGNPRSISSTDMNQYIFEITGQNFTAKDYRTWGGSIYGMQVFQQFCETGPEDLKKNTIKAVEAVAKRLGNTTAVCKKYYIHPAVMEAYLKQSLGQLIESCKNRLIDGLHPEEIAFITLLEKRLENDISPAG
jgi:DNA topoisomerase-1